MNVLRLKLPNNNITDEDIEVALTVHAKNHKLKHDFARVGKHQDELVTLFFTANFQRGNEIFKKYKEKLSSKFMEILKNLQVSHKRIDGMDRLMMNRIIAQRAQIN